MTPRERPQVGDFAPDFALGDPSGRTLAGFRGLADVVIFFYPKDQSPGVLVSR